MRLLPLLNASKLSCVVRVVLVCVSTCWCESGAGVCFYLLVKNRLKKMQFAFSTLSSCCDNKSLLKKKSLKKKQNKNIKKFENFFLKRHFYEGGFEKFYLFSLKKHIFCACKPPFRRITR